MNGLKILLVCVGLFSWSLAGYIFSVHLLDAHGSPLLMIGIAWNFAGILIAESVIKKAS